MTIGNAEAAPPVAPVTGVGAGRPGAAALRSRELEPAGGKAKDGGEVEAKREARPSREVRRAVALPELPLRDIIMRRDEDLNRVIVQVVDSETGEVVRAIPPEEVVETLKQLRRTLGTFLDEEA